MAEKKQTAAQRCAAMEEQIAALMERLEAAESQLALAAVEGQVDARPEERLAVMEERIEAFGGVLENVARLVRDASQSVQRLDRQAMNLLQT